MAIEGSRTTSVRRITNPDDAAVYVDLKVIDKISFYDGRSKGLVTEYDFRNDTSSGRTVTPHTITGTAGNIDVEIIRHLFTYNGRDRGQEADWSFFNPATFPPEHLEYRDDKVYADGGTNTDVWIKVRRVVAAKWYNPRDRGQELEIRLTWSVHDDYTDLTPLVTEYDGTSINPPWRLDPFQQIIDVSWEPRYLAVFYSGGRIAAVPMSKLLTDPTPVYDRPANGTWGAGIFMACQLKLTAGYSVIMSPLKVEDTVVDGVTVSNVTLDPSLPHQYTTTQRKPTDPELPIIKALSQFGTAAYGQLISGIPTGYPGFNGLGDSYFSCSDDFVVSDSGITVTYAAYDYGGGVTNTITATGVRYQGHLVSAGSPIALGIAGSDFSSSGFSDYMSARAALLSTYVFPSSAIGYLEDGTMHIDISTGYIDVAYPNYVHVHDSMSKDIPWPFYGKVGGIDFVAVDMKGATLDVDYDEDIGGSASVSWQGKSYTNSGPGALIAPFKFWDFPFALSPTRIYAHKSGSDPTIDEWDTPYGTFNDAFAPWMHISNGTHTLQGFQIGTDNKMFLDDVAFSVTGIADNDVQMVLMDIPLARIQELAPPPPPP